MAYFFKLEIKSGYDANETQFREIEFYDFGNKKIDITNLSVVSGSNTYSTSWGLGNLIDGVTDFGAPTYGTSLTGAYPKYFILKSEVVFKSVKVYSDAQGIQAPKEVEAYIYQGDSIDRNSANWEIVANSTYPKGLSVQEYDDIGVVNRVLILHDNVYKKYNTVSMSWEVVNSTTPTEQNYRDGNSLLELSMIQKSSWDELTGLLEICYYTDNLDAMNVNLKTEVEPFSVYDYISENPQAIVYTESTDDITVSTTTEPYDLYDEFGDELEVLYYTDDEAVIEADLILEANWSPIDELDGDFEVVTWTDETQETSQRTLEMTAVPVPQFIKSVSAKSLTSGVIDLSVIDRSYGYKNNTRFLITDTYGINWYVWNKKQNKFVIVDTTNNTLLDVGMTADEINGLTPEQWALWSNDTINIGIYMCDNPRSTIVSMVEDVSYQENVYKYSPELSNLLFYILNTTAKINIHLDGNVLKGEVSDDDLTRVQYRVLLNGFPYFPNNGEFSPLGAPPVNIDLVITGDNVKIDEDNVLRVEFKDYFGTVDYWQTNFTGMYAGLIFKDIYGDYYSTDIGEVLKYLDFGDIIAGQTTIEHEVLLKNQYGFDVGNLVLRADSSEFPSGLEAQFSKTQSPFISEPELNFNNLTNNTEMPFFVRLKTQLGVTPVANGDFAITVNADKT